MLQTATRPSDNNFQQSQNMTKAGFSLERSSFIASKYAPFLALQLLRRTMYAGIVAKRLKVKSIETLLYAPRLFCVKCDKV